jgi:predicted RNA-binding Zn-ribbon protein involved in translation (DUF1610 family)
MKCKTCIKCGNSSFSSSDRYEWICPNCGTDLTKIESKDTNSKE